MYMINSPICLQVESTFGHILGGNYEFKIMLLFFWFFLNIFLYRSNHYFKFVIPTMKMA